MTRRPSLSSAAPSSILEARACGAPPSCLTREPTPARFCDASGPALLSDPGTPSTAPRGPTSAAASGMPLPPILPRTAHPTHASAHTRTPHTLTPSPPHRQALRACPLGTAAFHPSCLPQTLPSARNPLRLSVHALLTAGGSAAAQGQQRCWRAAHAQQQMPRNNGGTAQSTQRTLHDSSLKVEESK